MTSEWLTNEERTITVVTDANVNLSAFYAESDAAAFTPIPGTFTQSGSRYYLNYTFTAPGNYTIRVVDLNGNISDIFAVVNVVDDPYPTRIHESLDSYPNKDSFKGLTTAQETALNDIQADLQTILNSYSPEEVWNYLLSNEFEPGSAGDKLKQVLTIGNYIALK